MLKLVEEHGTRYWALIGAKLNGRTGKQVSCWPVLWFPLLRVAELYCPRRSGWLSTRFGHQVLYSHRNISLSFLCSAASDGTTSWTPRSTRIPGPRRKR